MNRQDSQWLIIALQRAIDEASEAYVLTGNGPYKKVYDKLVSQIVEIKEAILESEANEDITNSSNRVVISGVSWNLNK